MTIVIAQILAIYFLGTFLTERFAAYYAPRYGVTIVVRFALRYIHDNACSQKNAAEIAEGVSGHHKRFTFRAV
jgi:hypothetical protein